MDKIFDDVNKFVLGSAQLGLNYGICNTTGKARPEVAKQIIESCIYYGVNYIDTASAYGNSEEVIGDVLADSELSNIKVITKINFQQIISNKTTKIEIFNSVDFEIKKSIKNLKSPKIFCLLLHRASDLTDYSGSIWSRLLKLKCEGYIQKLGVSVQTPDELNKVLEYTDVEFIQLPMNILDDRWTQSVDLMNEARLSRDITVHVRSIFLQGLLLSDNETHWQKANCVDGKMTIDWLQYIKVQLKRSTLADLCVVYVRSLPWVDGVVIGMESIDQLNYNLPLFHGRVLTQKEMTIIEETRPKLTPDTLNPAKWKK